MKVTESKQLPTFAKQFCKDSPDPPTFAEAIFEKNVTLLNYNTNHTIM
jgi:hypothetical protein